MGQGCKGNPAIIRHTDTHSITGLKMEEIRRLLSDILTDDAHIERIEIEPNELRVTYYNPVTKPKNSFNPSLKSSQIGK
jgi:hypothetical protein